MILDFNSDGSFVKYLNGLGIDDKIRQTINGQAQYFVQDHLGSTNALTDASGNTISSATYDSFGNVAGNLNSRYEYTGREKDAETGLYFYRNRWYSSESGRFISEDPIGFAGGDVNLYGYVRNNPVNRIDPSGLIDLGWGSPTGPNIPYSNFPSSGCNKGDLLPNWLGYNTTTADGIWWKIFWDEWNRYREEGPVIFGSYSGGPFSVIDWEGYPDSNPPDGPFRLLDGAEYEEARRLANNENQRLHRNNSSYDGKQLHEVNPVKFGGSPTDPNNKVALTPQEHARYTRFWNRLMRSIKR